MSAKRTTERLVLVLGGILLVPSCDGGNAGRPHDGPRDAAGGDAAAPELIVNGDFALSILPPFFPPPENHVENGFTSNTGNNFDVRHQSNSDASCGPVSHFFNCGEPVEGMGLIEHRVREPNPNNLNVDRLATWQCVDLSASPPAAGAPYEFGAQAFIPIPHHGGVGGDPLPAQAEPGEVFVDVQWHATNDCTGTILETTRADADLETFEAWQDVGGTTAAPLGAQSVRVALHTEREFEHDELPQEFRVYWDDLSLRPDLPGDCDADGQTLCLGQGRYTVTVDWRTNDGRTGVGHVVPFQTSDSGLFWFFTERNWELMVKVLNGCNSNGRSWVFAAGTTNVEFTLTVVDTVTGDTQVYDKEGFDPAPAITDVRAFDNCPE